MMEELVLFLRARTEEEAAAAEAWPEDQRRWETRGPRWLSYASGSGEGVSAISVGGSGPLGWERIYVKRDGVGLGSHIASNDPASILAKAAARQALFEMYDHAVEASQAPDALTRIGGGPVLTVLDEVFRRLALEYTGHPGYSEAWRPREA